jgi:HPt (histidine-containing phosphotransfer) domain-containing protein
MGSTAPPPQLAPPVLIDWQVVLAGFRGDRQLVGDVVATVRIESPRLLDSAQVALAAGDFETLGRLAHTLKGSLRYFGPTEAYQAAVALEQAARTGPHESAPLLFAQAVRLARQLCEHLAECVERGLFRLIA